MSTELGIIIAIIGLTISFFTYQMNRTKVIKTDIQNNTEIKTRLDYIGKGVDDIRIDLRTNEKQMNQLSERITRLEESSKQSHKRLANFDKENC
ncbi:hypothetical protein [Bacillus sp. Au-Bac7]|uniref:hypothetical protein n=1 Tax=Bacillus sp. Au-Bac7 TaxID=2906458 RepID=UPI001E4DA052|nr:hypothetical protein [Bacillus sp. Au-Bac7]MCE4052118.1 hypothetical protein [Bacillus sp. Au-Bac7]